MSGGEGMIIRNGVNSTLRARGRAALFFALILVLTLALSLGLGMWSYCSRALAALDQSYTSIALVEYMGADYPDPDTADDYARQAAQALDGAAISALDGVELWEVPDQALAAMEGYLRTDSGGLYADYGILVAGNLSAMSTQGAWSTVGAGQLSCQAILEGDHLVSLYGPNGEVQAQVPCFEYGSRDGVGPGYWICMRQEDGRLAYELTAPEELPQAYYVLDGFFILDVPRQGQYYGPDLGWDTRGYLGQLTDSGQYQIYGETVSYTGSLLRALYSPEGKDSGLAIFEVSDRDFAPEPGEKYLLHGRFTNNGSSNLVFSVLPFYDGCPTAPWLKLSGEEDPAQAQGLFAEYAQHYHMVNNYLRLEASDDVAALEPFHQNALHLTQGRFPQAGEMGVCVVDGRTAMQMGLALGDRLELELLASQEGNRFDLSSTQDVRSLEVVGITNDSADYDGWVWVSGGEGGFGAPHFGYLLGRAVLDNAQARQGADALQAMAPEGVRVTLYDQGYSAAAQPLQAMRSTSLAITAACICGAAAVLLLFGYLFVGRQRDTVAVLVSLGTPTGKVRLWLLSGVVVIAGAAALLGALAGRLSTGIILGAALAAAQGLYAADQRYSEAVIGVAREMPEAGALPWWPAAAAAAGVFVAALLLCLAFLSLARRQSTPKQGRISVRAPKGGTSTAGSGPARFALLSARRGGWRSGVVPAAALALTLLLGLLASTAQGWGGQIAGLYDTTTITGEVTSTNGRQATDLMVPARNARLLWESGMLEDLSVSLSWHYWFAEDMPAFGTGGFAAESLAAWVNQQPELVALNRLDAAPAFYYENTPEVEWLEGWNGDFLGGPVNDTVDESRYYWQQPGLYPAIEAWQYPCLVNQNVLIQRGLELGDIFELLVSIPFSGQTVNMTIRFQIVGAYSGSGSQKEIYVPLSFWCHPSWLLGGEDCLGNGEPTGLSDRVGAIPHIYSITSFSTCRFTLRSPYDLNAFRDYLTGEEFSQVGHLTRNRTTVVLRDQAFVETVSGLGRYVTFSWILLSVLCGAVGLIGFLISWLMVSGRRMEFAVMRGLGASRGRVFWSFFLEQGGLALAGCVLGGLILTPLGAGWAGWLAAAGFWICYLAGCTLAVAVVGRVDLIAFLSQSE